MRPARDCPAASDAGARRATGQGRRCREQGGCAGRDDRGATTGSSSLGRRHLPHAGAGGGRQRTSRRSLHAPHLAGEPVRPGGSQPGRRTGHRAVHAQTAAMRGSPTPSSRCRRCATRRATCASCARPSAEPGPRRGGLQCRSRRGRGVARQASASFRPGRRLTR